MARKRNPRVDRQVRAALADLIETELADPRLAFITLTEVDVTPDQEVATVYYSTLDPAVVSRDHRRTGGDRVPTAEEVADGIEAVLPRLRSLLATRLRLRVTPELRFRPDPVVAQAARVEQLLRDVAEQRAQDGDDDGDDGVDRGGSAPADRSDG